jgi:Tol biopolymer transport system component
MLNSSPSPIVALLVAFSLLATGGCTDPPGSDESTAADSIADAAPGTDVYVASLDTTGDSLRAGPPRPVTTRPGYDNQPAFTLDGDGLVWTAIRGGQADVYRWAAEEDTSRQLTDTPESEFSPTPRPNDRMTVVRVEGDGRQRLWTYRADGTPLDPVLPDADSVGYHAWLDGTRVALFVLGSPPTLHVVDVAAGTDTVVTDRIGRSLRSVPGRSAVSFVRFAPDSTTTLHLLDGQTLATRRLTDTPEPGTGVYHAWTPDGQVLMAAGGALRAWRRGGDRWRTVARLDTLDVSRLAVSPSGDRVALVAAE